MVAMNAAVRVKGVPGLVGHVVGFVNGTAARILLADDEIIVRPVEALEPVDAAAVSENLRRSAGR